MDCISKYIGKPFKDGGRGPEGFDCWGLVKAIYRDNGIDLPDFFISCLDIRNVNDAYKKEQDSGLWIKIGKPELLCVLAIAGNDKRFDMVSHFGVYIGNGKFIHTNVNTNAIVSRINDIVWARRIMGYYKWNGC